jgi:hypothetical protein
MRCQCWHTLQKPSLTVRREYAWGCPKEAVPGGRFCEAHGGRSMCAKSAPGEAD